MDAAFLDDPRFSRKAVLPADPENGRPAPFTVTYADYGFRNEEHPEEESVLLFFSLMLASRMTTITKDALAKEYGVRIICCDRPGMGGTDAVDIKEEIHIWTETTVALLKHLKIAHVSVACHSGGTIYAVDLLLHHPEVLHPDRPYFALGAPWILPRHADATLMSVTQMLPSGLVGRLDKLAQFSNGPVGSALGLAFGASSAFASKLFAHGSAEPEEANPAADAEEALWPEIIKRIYSEGIAGMASEALLFLQKVDGMDGWSDWGDFDVAVPRLAAAMQASGRRLTVRTYYAETDIMIGDGGTKGPKWLDDCWSDCPVDYASTVVAGSDHDGIWSLRRRTVREVFAAVGRAPTGTGHGGTQA